MLQHSHNTVQQPIKTTVIHQLLLIITKRLDKQMNQVNVIILLIVFTSLAVDIT